MQMYWCLLALSLLAGTSLAQPRPPPPAPNPPGPANQPRPSYSEGEEDKDEEDCPPRTGREWICKIDYWDPNQETIVNTEQRQRCYEDDMCYLGPLVSYPLTGYWERKWMCGPKPCRMLFEMQGEAVETNPTTCMGTCDVGPYDITVNETQYQAYYCNKSAAEGPKFAPIVCSVNSTRTGYMQLKECDAMETCGRGPAYYWHNATQYRVYLCTKTPGKSKHEMMPRGLELLYKVRQGIYDVAAQFVLAGFVTLGNPMEDVYTPHDYLRELHEIQVILRGGLMEDGHPDPWHLPLLERTISKIKPYLLLLGDKVNYRLEGGDADRHFEILKGAFHMLSNHIMGEEIRREPEEYIKKLGEYVMKLRDDLKEDDKFLDHDSVAAFLLVQDTLSSLREGLMEMPEAMKLLEDLHKMREMLRTLWTFMSNGPVMPDFCPTTLLMKLHDNISEFKKKYLMLVGPGKFIEKADDLAMKLLRHSMIADINDKDAENVFMHLHMELEMISEAVKLLPNPEPGKEIIERLVGYMQDLWALVTGSPVSVYGGPELVIKKIRDALGELRSRLGKMKENPPMPGYGGDGPMPGRDGGYDDDRRGRNGGYDDDRPGRNGGYDDDRRGRNGGYDDDRRGRNGGYDDDRRGRDGGYNDDRRGGNGGYDDDRRGGNGGYDDGRRGGNGGYDDDRRGGNGGYDDDRRGGDGGYDDDRRPQGMGPRQADPPRPDMGRGPGPVGQAVYNAAQNSPPPPPPPGGGQMPTMPRGGEPEEMCPITRGDGKEESCPQQGWYYMIKDEDKKKYRAASRSFFGPYEDEPPNLGDY